MTPEALLERDAQGLAILRAADYAVGIEEDGTLATRCDDDDGMTPVILALTAVLARRWFNGDTNVAWHFLHLLSDEVLTQTVDAHDTDNDNEV